MTSSSSMKEIIFIIDFAFSFEHFEHFMAKQLFKITSIGRWAYHEGVIVVKAAIGGENMSMRMKILKITLRAIGLRAGGQAHWLSLANSLRSIIK